MNDTVSQKIIKINKETYNKIARNFSNTRNRQWPEFDIFKNNHIKAGDSVLDIGCGNGRVCELLDDMKVKYVGIDISEGLIFEAKKKYPLAEFKVGDMLELDYQNSFDAVFCIASLNHIPSEKLQEKILSNIYTSLKPGGCLLMTNWNMWNVRNSKSWWTLKNNVNDFGLPKPGFKNVITYWGQEKLPLYYYSFTKRGLDKILLKIGFKIIDNYYSIDGKKTSWWKAKNIVSIVQK